MPLAGSPGFAGGAGQPVPVSQVIITTTGSSFAPSVTVPDGAVVNWQWNGGSAQGASPSISFGSAAARQVVMTVTVNGADAMSQVTVFNIGYNYSNDTGRFSPPPSYNKSPQAVSALANVRKMTGLVLFLAGEISTLAGSADFTGMAALTNVECYGSSFTSAKFTGCTSMQRIVLELCNLTTIDINPVLSTLCEFRVASQQGGSLTLTPIGGSLPNLYHWCTRNNTLTGMPSLSLLPVVYELWVWQDTLSGTFSPVSSALFNFQGYLQSLTSVDLTNQFPYSGTNFAYLDLHGNSIATVTLTGCGALGYIDLSSNSLNQAGVDGVLAAVDGFATSNGTLALQSNTAPSSTGLTHASNLTGRGWTVTHD